VDNANTERQHTESGPMTTALEASKALLNVGGLVSVLGVFFYSITYMRSVADCNPCGSPIIWFAYLFLFGLCLMALGLAFWLGSRKEKPSTESIQGEKLV